MNLVDLQNIAKKFTFYTKHINLSSKWNKMFKFDIFKGFLILTKFGKLGRKLGKFASSAWV